MIKVRLLAFLVLGFWEDLPLFPTSVSVLFSFCLTTEIFPRIGCSHLHWKPWHYQVVYDFFLAD